MWRVALPDDMPDDKAFLGIPLGPPDLRDFAAERGWPVEYEVRVHNQLFHRRIDTTTDERALRQRVPDIIQAINAAAKVDALAIVELILRDPAILPLDGAVPSRT